MNKSLIALALVAGCGASDQSGNDGMAVPQNGASPDIAARRAVADAVRTSGLTGLYEAGRPDRPDQLCIIDKGTGNAQFGLVVWGANLNSCAGSGSVVSEGGTLRLEMAGDETCRIEARLDGATVTLPQDLPAGCSYYCGPQARFSGATFTRRGATPADAMKARDLVGEPLCSR